MWGGVEMCGKVWHAGKNEIVKKNGFFLNFFWKFW